MGERQIEIWNAEIRKGKQMTGKSFTIDIEKGHMTQQENLRRQQLILHPKQEDFLLFNQWAKKEKSDKGKLPQIGSVQRASQYDQTDSTNIRHNSKLPFLFSRLEQFQNHVLEQCLKGLDEEFYSKEIIKVEEIVDKLRQG